MPARMPRRLVMLLCLAVLAAVAGACGEADVEQGVEEPAREGLAIDMGGIDYNVFITRQLNLSLPEDRTYYDGPPAPAGSALYGVFIQVCNPDEKGDAKTPVDDFIVRDTQGDEFEPIELPEDNHFAYNPVPLGPKQCIPASGSVAQLGPTAGAMLLFEFPQAATENRPLELEIGEGEHKISVELDL